MKNNIVVEGLKFLSNRNGEYMAVEMREFLLKNFEDQKDSQDRVSMRSFLQFLKNGEFIECCGESGISITVESGYKIPRQEISLKAKITSNGYELLREHNRSQINNAGVFSSIIFGILGVGFAIWGIWSSLSQNRLQEKYDYLKAENYMLKIEIFKDKQRAYEITGKKN